MRKILSLVPGFAFFVYFALKLEEVKLSSLMGLLAISIALGSIGYFHFNAPSGRRETETAFGITGYYRNPVYGTIIPTKTALVILSSIVLVCLFGLLLYTYGY